jgi:hypothetical protein
MKKIITVVIITLILALSTPIIASALTVDGTVYNRNMWCAIVTGGFGKHNGVNLANDNGQTANLVGSSGTPIASYGYWYNSALGIDRSKQVGAGGYVNGGYAANVAKSTWQWNNINTGVGYQGSISSPYRGISRDINQDLWSPTWKAGHNNLVWSFFLSDNKVSSEIYGLDSSDATSAKITITGTGLPKSTSYGNGETFKASGTTTISDSVRYGNYYASVFIPNASKYDITYLVTYVRGDKYADRNNNTNYYNYSGSGSFSSPSYYVESGGYLDVSVTVIKKSGTVIADLYKGSGVTEAYENKTFYLYNSSGGYIQSATTNTSGYAYFYDMQYGTYSVRASTPPANHYYDPTSQNVSLTGDSVSARFTLYRSTGSLQINYSTEDNLSKGNVRFKITSPSGTANYYYTDSSGQIILLNVITGSYRVEQMEAPPDYEKAGAIDVTIYRSSTTTVNIYNPILYDFAVEVSSPQSVEQMMPLTGTIVFKNNGGKNATGVPVQVKDGGNLIYNTTISIPANSSVIKTFEVDTSAVTTKLLWASINASKTKRENNMDDNYNSRIITITTSTNLQIEFINPNANYREGTEVISSFRVKNAGYNHITPASNLSVRLAVTYVQNGITKSISIPDAKQVIIPYGGDNLVFFRWTVPSSMAGLQFKLVATVDPTGIIAETNKSDNSVTVYRTIDDENNSTTPDTRYEAKMPSDFLNTNPPSRTSYSSLSWAVWEWENGWFKKNTYGLQIDSSSTPSIIPDVNAPSRKYANGVWTMGSGYGFTANWNVSLKTASGLLSPNSNTYTAPQVASLYLPEFMYSNSIGEYSSLERNGTNSFNLPINYYAQNSARLHFTPLWFPNGGYICQGLVSDIWTPAGMMYGYYNSNTITITGSAYDDWYIGYPR